MHKIFQSTFRIFEHFDVFNDFKRPSVLSFVKKFKYITGKCFHILTIPHILVHKHMHTHEQHGTIIYRKSQEAHLSDFKILLSISINFSIVENYKKLIY